MNIEQILLENPDIFSVRNNILLYCIRYGYWWLLRGLGYMLEGLENALGTIFQNIDFFAQDNVGMGGNGGGLFGALLPVFWALLVIGIMVVGFQLMTNTLKSKAQVPMNLILIIVVVVGMPSILTTLSNITKSAVGVFSYETSLTSNMFAENVTDLKYLDENNFSAAALEKRNNFPQNSNVRLIVDPVELMDYSSSPNGELLRSSLIHNSDGSVTVVRDGSKSLVFSDMFSKLYYRYQVNWFSLTLTLIAMLIAMIVVCIKVGVIIFNIAYSGIFMMLTAPMDISTGQRTKRIIQEIISMFGVIICILISFNLYIIAMPFAHAVTKTNFIAGLMLQIAFSIGMIGGPDIVQKILGIDAGMGKELQSMAAGMYMANNAGRAIKGAAGMAGDIAGAAGKMAKGAGIVGAAGAGAAASGIDNAYAAYKDAKANRPKKNTDGWEVGQNIHGESEASSSGNTGGYESLNSAENPLLGDGAPATTHETTPPSDMPTPPSEPITSTDTGSPSTQGSQAEDISDNSFDSNAGEKASKTSDSSAKQNAAGTPPIDSKRVSRDDTLGSAFSKMMGNTRPARAAKQYGQDLGTAYNVGKNTVDSAFENAKNRVPHVKGQEMDVDDSWPKKNQSSTQETIDLDWDDVAAGATAPKADEQTLPPAPPVTDNKDGENNQLPPIDL